MLHTKKQKTEDTLKYKKKKIYIYVNKIKLKVTKKYLTALI